MNIGIDAKTFSKRKTGIAIYLQDILKYFSEHDKENKYFLYSNKEIHLDFELGPNFKVCYYKAKIASLGIYFKLRKRLIKDKIDVFWGPEHILPKKSKFYRMIVTIHDLAFLKFKGICTYNNIIIQKMFARKSCKNADRVIAISNATKNDIMRFFKIRNEKISVIYNGISTYQYFTLNESNNYRIHEVKRKYEISNNYFLFVSTIEPRKNIINIVKGFEIYKKETNSSDKLVLMGGMGWKTGPIMSTIKNSQYNKDIILTGYVSNEEKESLYRNAKALIFPSLYEGFGIPILEAYSVGIPVITSNISAMPEVGGEWAYYVDNPKDFNEIGEKMILVSYLLNQNRIDINKLIEQSKKFSKDKCSLETFKAITRLSQ